VASSSLYGGTYNLLSVTLPRLGITTTFVDASNPENFSAAVQDNTRAFFVESLGNPKLDVLDLEAIAEHSKAAEVPFIVDNTVATPVLLNPIKHGANIVIHSLTKYIGGQGTSLGGAIIDAGTFNWANGKFPEFTEPSAGYHGLQYHDVLGAASYTFKLILEGLRAAKKIADNTKLFSLLANIGDTKSLIIHPGSTTHQQLDEAEQASAGVSGDLIRLSVGIEDIEDLKADLKAAFKTV